MFTIQCRNRINESSHIYKRKGSNMNSLKIGSIVFLLLIIIGLQAAILIQGDKHESHSQMETQTAGQQMSENSVIPQNVQNRNGQQSENPVVAEYKGQEITRNQVLSYIISNSGGNLQTPVSRDAFQNALDQMVRQQILLDRAQEENIAAEPQVQAQIEEARKRVLISAYAQQAIDRTLTDEKLKERYDQLMASQSAQAERKASHILGETKEEAEENISQLEEGIDFKELALEKSIGPSGERGGDLGYFTPGQMVPEFSKAVFEMDVGSFTKEPVKTNFGWHVIQVEDEREVELPSFEDIKDQLRSAMSQTALQELTDTWKQEIDFTEFDIFEDQSARQQTPVNQQPQANAEENQESIQENVQDEQDEQEDRPEGQQN